MSNFDVIAEEGLHPIKMWTRGVPVEESAVQQLRNLAAMPFVYKHIASMPDMHWGKGSTVGTVYATQGAVIPASVGTDIGCGMMAHRTSLTASDLPDSLAVMRTAIEAHVPHGRTDDGGTNDRGAWGNVPFWVEEEFKNPEISYALGQLIGKHPKIEMAAKRAPHQMGTLGTGNHFIEICLDHEQRVWVMLHSGSRGIGAKIGDYFIRLAQADMKRYFINLPDANLAYLVEGSEHFDDYIYAVGWAQNFARTNRDLMMQQVLLAMRKVLGREFESDLEAINCHHNYVQKERHFGKNVWLTRKGAVLAREGVMGIIPGSMGARSYIVRGKGNPESFDSCSHGAGRAMSRGEANRTITLDQHIAATQHVECRKDVDVIDESPAAYKPIDLVMKAQEDLVEVVYELTQVLNVKG